MHIIRDYCFKDVALNSVGQIIFTIKLECGNMNIVKIVVYSIWSLLKNGIKYIYSLYLLSRFNFGKGFKFDFPLDIRGKGRAEIGNNCRLGKHSFLTVKGRLKLGDLSHIHRDAYLIIENTAEFITGINFQLEPNCMIRVHGSSWEIGDNVSISSNCLIYSREKGVEGILKIGDNSNISNNTILDLSNDVIIGNSVAIANNCFIFSHNHDYTNKDVPSWKGGLILKPVKIEDGCWIGANSKILPGVTIGRRSVVAAGSVVTKNVPENTIVAGNPAKILKSI